MSGKTLSTLYRNCVAGDFGIIELTCGLFRYRSDTTGTKVLRVGEKTVYCLGANDERSYTKIRGLTIGGWYADEVNLHPQSFVEEAFRRSIVSSDRKNYWTLNPDTPNHWIYKEYIDRYLHENLPGYFWHHFVLADNPAITAERRHELEQQYTGVFYKRYILGLRVKAEGLIFDAFDPDRNIDENILVHSLRNFYVSADYGTVNPMTWGIWGQAPDGRWLKWREYYYNSKDHGKQKTDKQYGDDMDKFLDECEKEIEKGYDKAKISIYERRPFKLNAIVLDPSASSFKTELRSRGYNVIDAVNDVLPGIRVHNSLLYQGRLLYKKGRCPNTEEEYYVYCWDDKVGVEKPIKENDHCMDSDRYFSYTIIEKQRGIGIDFLR
jgi:PBSX family phage terminase large subunit